MWDTRVRYELEAGSMNYESCIILEGGIDLNGSTYSRWPDACRWGLALQQILSINVKGSQLTTKVLVANIEVKQLL